MSLGLSVSNIVPVAVNISALAAQVRDFGNAVFAGNSDVIDTTELVRYYTDITAVAADFGTAAPEYLAALEISQQNPRPVTFQISRWAKTATKGRLNADIRSTAEQLMSVFTPITAGSFSITIDGTPVAVGTVDLSAQTNLNGVAAIIQGKITPATCIWNSVLARFEIRSSTSGTASIVLPVGTPTPLSTALGITTAAGAQSVPGIALQTPQAFTAIMLDRTDWYALAFADVLAAEADILPVSALIQAADPKRIVAFTSQDASTLSAATTTDVPYQINLLKQDRTWSQYSSSDPRAAISSIARLLAVDYTGNNTTITGKFKQNPGVIPELLTQSQAKSLNGKSCNVYVRYNNNTSIIQEGVMGGGVFADERIGLDAMENAVQTALYNLFYQSGKIAQTDPGINELVGAIAGVMDQFNRNGFIAEGVWNAQGFGQLRRGQVVPGGYYIFAPPVALQSQSDREARKSPLLQVAAKLAGAVHFANVQINVNR